MRKHAQFYWKLLDLEWKLIDVKNGSWNKSYKLELLLIDSYY